ncbi:DUF4350 domain-containing protein [Rarobacter faecitabidus]|uniref:Uncharacterized protein DUF4350 n=1 Tax=Rarobacter faecitabidus TaxID=13243 RepID=A0A542ZU88_RARFA|nr:DUF4350 domain-containing protein [Rarobacter faecitabidus]TQL63921.1 uncharacterized protein DUF4350 [Rarobacter faecitabidus]
MTAPAPALAQPPESAVSDELRPRGKERRARARRNRIPARPRRRAAIAWVTVAIVVGVCAVLIAIVQPRTSATPFAPDNPDPAGARALAQILGRQGVSVTFATTGDEAIAELGASTRESTLLIAADYGISSEQSRSLRGKATSTVLIEPQEDLLKAFAPHLDADALPGGAGPVSARCDDPDAMAAEEIGPVGFGYRTDGEAAAQICFGVGGIGAMARSGDTTVLAASEPFTNEHLADYGNAALGLRVLGAHPRLVWLIPDWTSMVDGPDSGGSATAPQWIGPAGLALLLAVAFAMWSRGPRFGRVIPERLPVVVSPSELVHGRTRLYRRARDYPHAAALIRAGAVTDIARRLGIPPTAQRDTVVPAIAVATRRDAHEIDHLLYGPDPRSSAELTALSIQLNSLRREVNPA